MSLNQFFQDVTSELQVLLWRDQPSPAAVHELDHLERQVGRGELAVARQRHASDILRTQLEEKQIRAKRLAARIEIFLNVSDRTNAWNLALELDRLRDSLEADRRELARQMQTLRAQQKLLGRIKQRLFALAEQV